jgi:hypothetical protein
MFFSRELKVQERALTVKGMEEGADAFRRYIEFIEKNDGQRLGFILLSAFSIKLEMVLLESDLMNLIEIYIENPIIHVKSNSISTHHSVIYKEEFKKVMDSIDVKKTDQYRILDYVERYVLMMGWD